MFVLIVIICIISTRIGFDSGGGHYGPAETGEEQIYIPNNMVGLVIGKGGENSKK